MSTAGSQTSASAWLDQLLATDVLPRTEPHDCAYLEGLQARSQGFRAEAMPAELYQLLLERNFRRSGHVFYRAACDECHACRQIRVPVNTFVRSRSLQRVWKINADVRVTVDVPNPTPAKHEMYRRYLAQRHASHMSGDWPEFVAFLYESPIGTLEFAYYLGQRLLAVSIADVIPSGLSSVYVFFDPEYSRRSMGTFSALWEIEHCRRNGRAYYYLGYHVHGSKTMAYKARFVPHELLNVDGSWVRGDSPDVTQLECNRVTY